MGLAENTTYYYRVTAVDTSGNESNPSGEVNATTQEPSGPPLGDVNNNGMINIIDALQVARFDAGLSPSPFHESAADADCNGVINIIDALQIARYDAGLISSFECE